MAVEAAAAAARGAAKSIYDAMRLYTATKEV